MSSHFDDWLFSACPIVIRIEIIRPYVSTANDFALDQAMIGLLEIDGPTFIQRKQRNLRHRIRTVILLEHLQGMLSARIAQDNRIRLQMHGDFIDIDLVLARFQIQREILPHYRKILVIDCQ